MQRGEKTFENRHRALCAICWHRGNFTKKHPVCRPGHDQGFQVGETPYRELAAGGFFCTCTAKDGHICQRCKNEQNSAASMEMKLCFGLNCNNSSQLRPIGSPARICLWCCRPLPLKHFLAESRREYDARHMLARSHSSYERPEDNTEEYDITSYDEQVVLELDARLHRTNLHNSYLSKDCSEDCACGSNIAHTFQQGEGPTNAR